FDLGRRSRLLKEIDVDPFSYDGDAILAQLWKMLQEISHHVSAAGLDNGGMPNALLENDLSVQQFVRGKELRKMYVLNIVDCIPGRLAWERIDLRRTVWHKVHVRLPRHDVDKGSAEKPVQNTRR